MMGERMKVILLIFASCFLFFFVSSFWNQIKSQEYNMDQCARIQNNVRNVRFCVENSSLREIDKEYWTYYYIKLRDQVDKLCSPILKGKESCHCYTY